MKRRAGRVLLVLGSLTAALTAAEVALRAHEASGDAPDGDDGGWRERYRHMNETIYRRSEDPELVYEPVPSASAPMEYGVAGFDRFGMRDDRPHDERAPDGVTRVAVIGDSLVWGEFLAVHDTIPRRLEESLGDGFEVLNFGVTGYDTTQEAAWYAAAARRLHPDVVVVVWCMNDMMIMSGPFERFAEPPDRARKDAQEALFARVAPVRRETIDGELSRRERESPSRLLGRAASLFERWRHEEDYVDEYLVVFEQPDLRARTAAAIARLGHAIEEDGARALFVIAPVLERWGHYRWDAITAFVRARATAAGFTVLDPLPEWRETERAEDMRISGDNLHFDGCGARVFGRTIAEAVRELAR